MQYYYLIGRTPVPCSRDEWEAKFNADEYHICMDMIDEVMVSTAFLGMDLQWGDGPPILFETATFSDCGTTYVARCSTYDEAEETHRRTVEQVRIRQNKSDSLAQEFMGRLSADPQK